LAAAGKIHKKRMNWRKRNQEISSRAHRFKVSAFHPIQNVPADSEPVSQGRQRHWFISGKSRESRVAFVLVLGLYEFLQGRLFAFGSLESI
jgi:hypothetical protein